MKDHSCLIVHKFISTFGEKILWLIYCVCFISNSLVGGKKISDLDVISINDSEDDQTKVEVKDQDKGENKPEHKLKRGSRSKTAETKKADVDRLDVDAAEIDWETITPEEKEKHKELYAKNEREMMEAVMNLQHNSAVYPIGRDRLFRRYWVFCSIPGLYLFKFIINSCVHGFSQAVFYAVVGCQYTVKVYISM